MPRATRAAHAVADFYAHSAYGLLAAPTIGQSLAPVNRTILDDKRFWSYQRRLFSEMPGSAHTPDQALEHWNGQPLSGQWWRWYAPIPDDLQDQPDFEWRRSLPDHDRLAVDQRNPDHDDHVLPPDLYRDQFGKRFEAARVHLARLWNQRAAGGADPFPAS